MSGSWPAPRVARSWSSSTGSIPTTSLPGGPASAYDSAPQGRLAQWLEHAVHIRGVTGSNPVSPTTLFLPTLTDRSRRGASATIARDVERRNHRTDAARSRPRDAHRRRRVRHRDRADPADDVRL